MINIQKMMQQAQQVQFKLQEIQEKLKDIDVTGESGGGLVQVIMSCAGVIRNVSVDPSLLTPENKEMLEDLIAAAVNSAGDAKDARVQEETRKLMKEMGLPEGGQLPF